MAKEPKKEEQQQPVVAGEVETTTPQSDDQDFSEFLDDNFDDDTSGEEASTEALKAEAEAEAGEKVPAAEDAKKKEPSDDEPKKKEQAAEKEGQTPAEPEATEKKPEEKQEQVPPATPEELQAQYVQFETQAVDMLSKQVYALNDDQIAELEENPAEAFPKMAALVHFKAMQAAMQNVARMLPQMMEAHLNQKQTSTSMEEQFFSANEHLRPHREAVARIGQVYRQLNPQATAEEFIRDVGAQVSVALKLVPEAVQQQAQKPEAKQIPPHKPAAVGATASAIPAQSTNEFVLMSQEEDA